MFHIQDCDHEGCSAQATLATADLAEGEPTVDAYGIAWPTWKKVKQYAFCEEHYKTGRLISREQQEKDNANDVKH